jgi:GAF domain-containing protein
MNNQLPRGGREQLVATAFVSLADNLVDDYDVIELLTRLVGYSVQLLGADAGGIMLADPHGQLRVVAASDEHAELIELMQLQNDQGPCLACNHAGAPVSVADLGEATDRWPKFIPAAMNQNVFRAVHAVPLRLRGEAIGALTLCHHQPGPMSTEDLTLSQALADVATIAILQERAIRRAEILTEQLQNALDSRVVIEQAKGVLGQHARLRMDEAFHVLRSYARSGHHRLAQVAQELVERRLDPATVLAASSPPGTRSP